MVTFLCLLSLHAPILQDEQFRDLFNGKDLHGWQVEGPAKLKTGEPIWTVTADGCIRARAGKDEFGGGGFGFLRYKERPFGNFILRLEYRFEPAQNGVEKGNSGVGIRTGPFDRKQSRTTRPSYASYEIQLLDDAGKPPNKHCTGSLYRYVAPKSNPAKTAPAWNTLEIRCEGSRIGIRLNGVQIVDADQNEMEDLPAKNKPAGIPSPKHKPLSGFLALQSHSGTVEFRHIQIRELLPY